MSDGSYLTPRELSARIGISDKTMANWRCLGKGPKSTKLGGSVRYHVSDIADWEVGNTPEARIQRYLAEVGIKYAGDDPVGFLIASHRSSMAKPPVEHGEDLF